MNAARRTSSGDAALIPAGLLDVLLQRPDFHTFICLDTYFFRFNVTRKTVLMTRACRQGAGAGGGQGAHRQKNHPRRRNNPLRISSPMARPITHRRKDWVTTRNGRENYWRGRLSGAGDFPAFQYLFNASAGGGSKIHEKIAVELQQMWRDELGIQMDFAGRWNGRPI